MNNLTKTNWLDSDSGKKKITSSDIRIQHFDAIYLMGYGLTKTEL